jgi:lipid A 3-O-deacylase
MRVWKVWVCVGWFLLIFGRVSPLVAAPSGLAISAGQHNVLDGGDGSTAGAEVFFAPRRFQFLPRFLPPLAPFGGMLVASRGSLYVYGGLRLDVPLGRSWVATPSFAAGIFRRGSGQELGGPVEFRSSLELAYELSAGTRIGLSLSHLSNGGLYDRNPGTESLVLVWSAGFQGRVLSSRPGGKTHGR